MGDLFSGNPDVKEGLERWGWQRIPGAAFGYAWKDAHGNLYTEHEAILFLERREREGRGEDP